MTTKRITVHQGLRFVSATRSTLMLSFLDGTHFQLDNDAREVERMLTEIAKNAPHLLHEALETRLIDRLTEELQYRLERGT